MISELKIGIVGAQAFNDDKLIEWFIKDLPLGVKLLTIAGNLTGEKAAFHAKLRGITFTENKPDLKGCSDRAEKKDARSKCYQRFAEESDLIVAFTEKEKGLTWDIAKRARRLDKPVKFIRPSTLNLSRDIEDEEDVISRRGRVGHSNATPALDDTVYAENKGEDEGSNGSFEIDNEEREEPEKGSGPFQLRKVSMGSYALRRKSNISKNEWDEIVKAKSDDPAALAEKMLPEFIQFFKKSKNMGYIHAFTVAPRSIKNLNSEHVMNVLVELLAAKMNIPFVKMFAPWEKSSRGRYAEKGQIEILPEVGKYVGNIIWVLDDITVTNFTLSSAVEALLALNIHGHGLAYAYLA